MEDGRLDRRDRRTAVIAAVVLTAFIGIAVTGLAVAQHSSRAAVGERFAQRADFLAQFTRAAIVSTVDGRTEEMTPMYASHGLSDVELAKFRDDFAARYVAEYDGAGRVLRVDPPEARPLALAAAKTAFVRSAIRGRGAMSDVVRDHGTPIIGFATPFSTPDGRRVLTDVSEVVGFNELFKGVLRGAPGVQHGTGLLVDGAGVVLASSGGTAVNRLLADKALRGELVGHGAKTSFELAGSRWQVRHIAGTSSHIAIGAPTGELYAPVNGATRILPWIYLLALSLAAVGLVVLLRRVMASREEVRRASLAKTEFLASASHELRSPLNGIIGFSQLLRDGKLGEITDVQADALDDVLSSSEHLLGLVSGLLDVTRAEAGTIEFKPEPVVLADVLDDVRTGLSALSDAKRIDVAIELDPELPPEIVLDPMRLRQVLFNFLSNALKHTPELGFVEIRADAVHPGRVRLSVTDTGPGVPREKRSELFTRYAKLDGTTEGTGLGLAVTKQIVEAQGGTVGFRPAPGGGASFFAELGIAVADRSAPAAAPA